MLFGSYLPTISFPTPQYLILDSIKYWIYYIILFPNRGREDQTVVVYGEKSKEYHKLSEQN